MTIDPKRQPGVQFGQIFVSSVQFSHREDALALPTTAKHPQLDFDVQVSILTTADERSAAVIFRVSSKDIPEALYKVSVELTALVEAIPGEENIPPAEYAAQFGAGALYPFIREAIANITSRGRFGPIYLKPFNFTVGSGPSISGPARRAGEAQPEPHAKRGIGKTGERSTAGRHPRGTGR